MSLLVVCVCVLYTEVTPLCHTAGGVLDPDFSVVTLTTSDVCVACTQITLMPFSHS